MTASSPSTTLDSTRAQTGAAPAAPSTRRTTLAWVSWVRVIAILGVVMIHTAGATAVVPGARGTVRGQVAIALDLGFMWAVPVFVMVSGALLLDPARSQSGGAFLRKRAMRIVPPLVFWHLFYIAFLAVDEPPLGDPGGLVSRILTGHLVTHLYFFWIILGLAVVTPVLLPWLRSTRRREWVAGGTVATLIPLATGLYNAWFGSDDASSLRLETAWTWWALYLGMFILGWALRGVVLRGRVLATAAAALVGLLWVVVWSWRNPDAPDWLTRVAPVNYYGIGVLALSVLVFLVAQSMVRRHGLLSALTSPRVMRWVEPVGAATLGIFGLHLAVLNLVVDTGWFGPSATSVPLLLLRYAAVAGLTVAIVLPLRRVRVIRSVL